MLYGWAGSDSVTGFVFFEFSYLFSTQGSSKRVLPWCDTVKFGDKTSQKRAANNCMHEHCLGLLTAFRHWLTGRWGATPTPRKFRSFPKAEPNSQFRGKYIRNSLIRI
jgi:hypothetical protein